MHQEWIKRESRICWSSSTPVPARWRILPSMTSLQDRRPLLCNSSWKDYISDMRMSSIGSNRGSLNCVVVHRSGPESMGQSADLKAEYIRCIDKRAGV